VPPGWTELGHLSKRRCTPRAPVDWSR